MFVCLKKIDSEPGTSSGARPGFEPHPHGTRVSLGTALEDAEHKPCGPTPGSCTDLSLGQGEPPVRPRELLLPPPSPGKRRQERPGGALGGADSAPAPAGPRAAGVIPERSPKATEKRAGEGRKERTCRKRN